MDPICHTLVGAALAHSGLRRWSARATATLVIAANLPDVDIVAIALGRNLELRRGLTHGVPALAVWPFVLATIMVWWHRRRPSAEPARFWPLAGLAAIGVVSHSFLDFLNNYGMRWLMPVADRWFYGDSLFIVDPWLYLMLGAGAFLSWRAHRVGRPNPTRSARVGLAAATIYVGGMIGTTQLARAGVAREVAGTPLAGARFMATAVPVGPLVKEVMIDAGAAYHLGRYRLIGTPHLSLDTVVEKGTEHAAAAARFRETPAGAAFFHWSRFPVVEAIDGERIRAFDLRYGRGARSWAAIDFTPTGAAAIP
ncbi:MAG: metal-dependent hydrolase [Gemmatimonadales bacterium]